jgi:hypothetical protein
MSAGYGRVERILVQTFQNSSGAAITTDQLVRMVWPDLVEVLPKQRSSVRRAAKGVLSEVNWGVLRVPGCGGYLIYYDNTRIGTKAAARLHPRQADGPRENTLAPELV